MSVSNTIKQDPDQPNLFDRDQTIIGGIVDPNLSESDSDPEEDEARMDGLNRPDPFKLEGDVAENWRKFKRDYKLFMTATGRTQKPKPIQAATLLNLIGEEAMELYETLDIGEEERLDPDKILEAFDNYTKPQLNETFERFVFGARSRQEGETIDHYLADLKRMAKTCNYDALTDSIIRDNIIKHMIDKSLQQNVLKIKNLTLQTLIENIKTSEASQKQAAEFQEGSASNSVCAIQKRIQSRKKHEYSKKSSRGKGRDDRESKRWDKGKHSSSEEQQFRCQKRGTTHAARQCPAFGKKCERCKRENHFAAMCRCNYNIIKTKVHAIQSDTDSTDVERQSDSDFSLNSLTIKELKSNHKVDECKEVLVVENKKIKFKIDTGASINVLPYEICKKLRKESEIKEYNHTIRAYGGFCLTTVGKIKLLVEYKGKVQKLKFIIVKEEDEPILGYKDSFELGIIKKADKIGVTDDSKDKKDFIKKNEDIFQGIGKFPNTIELVTDKNVKPVANPPRRVPNAIKRKLKDYLDELEKQKIITKYDNPESWVSNLVVIEKEGGSLRICLDPQPLNNAIKRSYYEIPTPESIATKLSGKKYFTVLDLKDGFWQVEISESSSKLCAFSTPFGCYRFNRLPIGLNCAPEIFQRLNEENFRNIPGVTIYFDDLLITGETQEEHDHNLNLVVKRAREKGIKFNRKKVQYKQTSVTYLGYEFSEAGRAISPDRIEAILRLKEPTNVKELQRIIGMINYLRDFIPNLSTDMTQMRKLLTKDVDFQWLPQHRKELEDIKQNIVSATILQNFDETKDITIQTDASSTGVGCCLLQDKGPVAFASRSLTETETRYAQIEKELLGIVYAVKKFHHYIYGRRVTIVTDHKPLVSINMKEISKIGSARLQRLVLKLVKYQLKIQYLQGKYMYIADLLSRNYLPNSRNEEIRLNDVVHSISKHLAVTAERKIELQRNTSDDPELSTVSQYCQTQWPRNKKAIPEAIQIYWNQRNNIYVSDNLVFNGDKVIIPTALRKDMLDKLHEGHLGITKMKAKARSILYWPKINNDIESKVKKCTACSKYSPAKIKEPLIPHSIPDRPYQKIGSDIFEYGGKNYLVTVDYYSRWIDFQKISSKTASAVFNQLKTLFTIHGIPEIIVADNMPFSSLEFKQFAKEWNFEVTTTSPNYPQSNGLAEKAVYIAKQILRKCSHNKDDLDRALLLYRNAPVAGLPYSPAQLLMSRNLRTVLPTDKKQLVPTVLDDAISLMQNRQKEIKNRYDKSARKEVDFSEGEKIFIRNKKQWEPAEVIKKHNSPRSFIVCNESQRELRRSTRHMKKSNVN